jgi:N-acetylmuramic acid 6-phosphate etherase
MLTTISMVPLGKVYENLMVDLRASNNKLRDRSIRIIRTVTNLSNEKAAELLERAGGHVKAAIVMQQLNVTAEEARKRLDQAQGRLRIALRIEAL